MNYFYVTTIQLASQLDSYIISKAFTPTLPCFECKKNVYERPLIFGTSQRQNEIHKNNNCEKYCSILHLMFIFGCADQAFHTCLIISVLSGTKFLRDRLLRPPKSSQQQQEDAFISSERSTRNKTKFGQYLSPASFYFIFVVSIRCTQIQLKVSKIC